MTMGENGEIVATPSAGTSIKTGFGDRTIATQAETSASAVAAQQTAMVQAAYIMAERRPRNFDQVRVVLLATCARPGFAKAARYKKPVGKEKDENGRWVQKFAEGLSIRFAEEAARSMGNLRMDSFTVYDDPKKKIVKFVVLDLESNAEWSKTVTIEKTVEKKFLNKGQSALATRINSYGDAVFIVEATAEEIDKKEGAAASKAWRDGILKNMPADIKDECMAKTFDVITSRDAADPAQGKKDVIDAFAKIGVKPIHLQQFVGHELDTLSPHELDELRGIWSAINDGETTWAAVWDDRRDVATEQAREDAKTKDAPADGATPPAGVDGAMDAARKKREASKAAATPRPQVGIAMVRAKAASLKPPLTEPEILRWYEGIAKLDDLSPAQIDDALERIGILAGHK